MKGMENEIDYRVHQTLLATSLDPLGIQIALLSFFEKCWDLLKSVYIKNYLIVNKAFKKQLHTMDFTPNIKTIKTQALSKSEASKQSIPKGSLKISPWGIKYPK